MAQSNLAAEKMKTKEEEKRIVTEAEKIEAKNFNIDDLPDVPTGLPPHLQLQRTRVVCKIDAPIHVKTILDQNYSPLCSVLLLISSANLKFIGFSQWLLEFYRCCVSNVE